MGPIGLNGSNSLKRRQSCSVSDSCMNGCTGLERRKIVADCSI